MKRLFLALICLVVVFSSCMAKKIEMYQVDLEIFAQSWIGAEASNLMLHYPDCEVTEVGDGAYRYRIDFEGIETWKEAITHFETDEHGRTFVADPHIHVYFTARNGVIESYFMKRTVGQKRRESMIFK